MHNDCLVASPFSQRQGWGLEGMHNYLFTNVVVIFTLHSFMDFPNILMVSELATR